MGAAGLGLNKGKGREIPENNDCGYTDAATEGPFFIKNSPEAVNLNYTNLPGKAMKVSGVVFGDAEGKEVISNAKIEVWHCDSNGVYYPTGRGDISQYKESEIALRGYVITSAKGEYAFHSIVPGLYSGRRRHIHYKISAPGYHTLTTQSYWLDEKGTERERIDRTDRNTEECRYIDFKPIKNGVAGIFHIYLRPL